MKCRGKVPSKYMEFYCSLAMSKERKEEHGGVKENLSAGIHEETDHCQETKGFLGQR